VPIKYNVLYFGGQQYICWYEMHKELQTDVFICTVGCGGSFVKEFLDRQYCKNTQFWDTDKNNAMLSDHALKL
jgi:tRNA A37 threonylcarbamoyladenosine dehydratase